MKEWLMLMNVAALPPGVLFAAGAMTVTLVQCVIVAWARRQARRRAARTHEFTPTNPDLIWAALKQLRADCETSTTNLEMSVATLKEKALGRIRELGSKAHEVQHLHRALEEKASAIGALEEQRADLERWRERHLLQLHRKDEELSTRADALATAERTIALLKGMLEFPAAARTPAPGRGNGVADSAAVLRAS
jgi:predicted RNase H-like nuclease (RuvC/YqgF family)